MASDAAIIAVVRGEPVERLHRLLEACGRQTVPCRTYVAAPPSDAAALQEAAQRTGVDLRHVVNPDGRRSAGLNRAIAEAGEAVLCRVDARTVPPDDYVERCLSRLTREPCIGIVGGVQRPVPGNSGRLARGLARALANPYAVGAPAYRRGAHSGPADTVYLGAFRRHELIRLGGFDESLVANEDFELAARYRTNGYMVFLDAEIVHNYEARARVGDVLAQYRAFGVAKADYWLLLGRRPNARQWAALLGLPVATSLFAVSRRRRSLALLGAAAVAFSDHAASPGEKDPAVRAIATITAGMLPAVWFLGVVQGLLGRLLRRGDPAKSPTVR